MKNNEKGIAEVGLLIAVIVGMFALFVPNPISSSLGVGIRPNKTVQKLNTVEKVELLKDEKGNPILSADGAYLVRRSLQESAIDLDKQQKVSIWEQLRSLPILWLLLMFLGGASPIIAGVMAKINATIRKKFQITTKERDQVLDDAKKIVKGMDAAFATVPFSLSGIPGEINREQLANTIIERMKMELRGAYNDSTKNLVKNLKS